MFFYRYDLLFEIFASVQVRNIVIRMNKFLLQQTTKNYHYSTIILWLCYFYYGP